ncbi:hypothetical protein [Actinoallomurus soli]|uniref:hypothetical protein n=1 Tax=Actinoallomurus soli TaxID=2952535 RepID=UPI002091FD35|nr:hypothetical protein [Actinoallomurus soli]MCO5974291.1 hypothetical protein [Actinoallomurus soli]
MSAAYTRRARWVTSVALVACAGTLLLTGARTDERTDPPGPGVPSAGPDTTAPGAAYADRSRVFGLVMAGPTAETVLFAPARKVQPGGPETVHPADVGRYVPLRLASGVVIRASAPIANDGVTDWVRGIRLTPEEFRTLLIKLQTRLHPLLDRSHMFELWFDGRGRITRMQHYFSP